MFAKLKLLIADDEPHICGLIKTLVHWDQLPLELVGICYDGEAALDEIKVHQPDIVITDIRMPGMTGLELIEASKAAGLKTHFIIISGFAQFDYAYSAIKYGVDDFLLKPIGEQELNDTLTHLCKKIQDENPDAASTKEPVSSLLDKAFLSALYNQELSPAECNAKHIQQAFHIVFPADRWIVGRIHLDKKDITGGYLYQLLESFSRKLSEVTATLCPLVLHIPRGDQLLFVLNYHHKDEQGVLRQLQKCLRSIQDILQPYPFMKVTISIVRSISSLSKLPHALAFSQTLCNSRYLLGTGRILDDSMVNTPLIDIPPYPGNYKVRMMEVFKQLNPAKGKELMRTLFRLGMPNTDGHPYLFYEHTMQLGTLALACLDSLVSLEGSYNQELTRMKKALANASAKDELVNELLAYFESLLAQLEEAHQNSENKIVQTVKNYVREHYSQPLELEDVAKQVYLNPTYLGTFFKRATKMNYSEYVTSVRIDEAKKLLEDVEFNVSEIAGKVGYKDANYFSRLFQKHVGIKPMEYRKLRHKQLSFR